MIRLQLLYFHRHHQRPLRYPQRIEVGLWTALLIHTLIDRPRLPFPHPIFPQAPAAMLTCSNGPARVRKQRRHFVSDLNQASITQNAILLSRHRLLILSVSCRRPKDRKSAMAPSQLNQTTIFVWKASCNMAHQAIGQQIQTYNAMRIHHGSNYLPYPPIPHLSLFPDAVGSSAPIRGAGSGRPVAPVYPGRTSYAGPSDCPITPLNSSFYLQHPQGGLTVSPPLTAGLAFPTHSSYSPTSLPRPPVPNHPLLAQQLAVPLC